MLDLRLNESVIFGVEFFFNGILQLGQVYVFDSANEVPKMDLYVLPFFLSF